MVAVAAAAAAPQSSCEPREGCWGDTGDGARATCWAEGTGWSCRTHVAACQCAACDTWLVSSGGICELEISPEKVGVAGQTHCGISFPVECCPENAPWVLQDSLPKLLSKKCTSRALPNSAQQ